MTVYDEEFERVVTGFNQYVSILNREIYKLNESLKTSHELNNEYRHELFQTKQSLEAATKQLEDMRLKYETNVI